MMRYKLPKTPPPPFVESGFTIVESLVALLVVALLLVAIAPVIVMSVGTRLQAKRVETSIDAAKKYVDGIRSGEITQVPNSATNLADFQAMAAPPGGSLNCSTANTVCSTQPATDYTLFCVNDDPATASTGCASSNLKAFVIQAFKYNGASTNTTAGYLLGLRVYRTDAFADSKALNAVNKPVTYAAGLGDRKSPLVELTTEITPGAAFSDFCNRIKNNGYTPGSTYNNSSPTPTAQSQC